MKLNGDGGRMTMSVGKWPAQIICTSVQFADFRRFIRVSSPSDDNILLPTPGDAASWIVPFMQVDSEASAELIEAAVIEIGRESSMSRSLRYGD